MSEQARNGFAVWTVLRRDALTAANAQPGTQSLADAIAEVEADGVTVRGMYDAVSYTHLTLPTNREV